MLVASLVAVVGIPGAEASHRHANSGDLPSMGPSPAPSIFGIDTSEFDTSTTNFSRDIPTAHSLGARWDHLTLGAATGAGNFRAIDYQVTQDRKRHEGVILSFGGVSSACSLHVSSAQVHSCPPTTAANLRAYGAYMRKVLLRYRKVVQYYESWTEPNRSSSWLAGPNPGRYAALLKVQYGVIQSVNHSYHIHLKLLFGSPSGFYIGPLSSQLPVLTFTQQVLAALHRKKPFDGVALHAYRTPTDGPDASISDHVDGIPAPSGTSGPFPAQGCNSTPQCSMTWAQELSAYEQEFSNHGYGQPPLWLTEFGWPGSNQTVMDVNSEAVQAQFLGRAYQILLSLPFVKGALWFNVRDYQPGLQSGDPAYFYFMGLLNYDFSQKSAAGTFSSIAAAHPGR
jgi:hypothetical protein